MSIIPINERRTRNTITGDQIWDSFRSFRDNLFSSLDTWRPFTDFPFPSPSSRFPDLFLDAFSPATHVNTRFDWRETRDAHVFKGYFPGLNRDDVEIQVGSESSDRVIKISGGSKFSGSFELPADARMDLVTADMENGFLVVTVPKEIQEGNYRPNVRVIEITED